MTAAPLGWKAVNELARDAIAPDLLQRDLTHHFVAENFANFGSLYRCLTAVVFAAEDFLSDRFHLLSESIERRHVLIFHHEQHVEVGFIRGLAHQDLVADDQVSFFFLFHGSLVGLGQTFDVIVTHACLCLDHGDSPDGSFCVGRAHRARRACCRARTGGGGGRRAGAGSATRSGRAGLGETEAGGAEEDGGHGN